MGLDLVYYFRMEELIENGSFSVIFRTFNLILLFILGINGISYENGFGITIAMSNCYPQTDTFTITSTISQEVPSIEENQTQSPDLIQMGG